MVTRSTPAGGAANFAHVESVCFGPTKTYSFWPPCRAAIGFRWSSCATGYFVLFRSSSTYASTASRYGSIQPVRSSVSRFRSFVVLRYCHLTVRTSPAVRRTSSKTTSTPPT